MRIAVTIASFLLTLTGCALNNSVSKHFTNTQGTAIQGTVYGGQQPIAGSHVYLLAAGTNGYGQPSVSLLTRGTNADSLGIYVASDANGNFSITGDYSCSSGQQVYLYALGGNPGAGSNAAAGLLSILGTCPSAGTFLATTPFININEVSTVAAAYSFAGFATDATHVSSSGTSLAQLGIANAFATASNLVTIASGNALSITSSGGTPDRSKINTLANAIAACINSAGSTSTACNSLLSNSTANGSSTGNVPSETATALINIAHNPSANVASIYALAVPNAPFQPSLTRQPPDLTVTISFPHTQTQDGNYSTGIAVDSKGNILFSTNSYGTTKFSPLGAILWTNSGCCSLGGGETRVTAIDQYDNLWALNYSVGVRKISSAGLTLFDLPSAAFGPAFGAQSFGEPIAMALNSLGEPWITDNIGQLLHVTANGGTERLKLQGSPSAAPNSIAFDGTGNMWLADWSNNDVVEFSPSLVLLGQFTAGGTALPCDLALDRTGSVWISDRLGVGLTELNASGMPLITNVPDYTAQNRANCTITLDGDGTAWRTASTSGVISSKNSTAVLAGLQQYPGDSLAIDGSGNIWTTPYYIIEIVGAAAPVVTPVAVAVATNMLGTRP